MNGKNSNERLLQISKREKGKWASELGEVEMAHDVNDKKKRNNLSSATNAAYDKETYKISKLYLNLQLRLHAIDQSTK